MNTFNPQHGRQKQLTAHFTLHAGQASQKFRGMGLQPLAVLSFELLFLGML